jgi:hypothetical protein
MSKEKVIDGITVIRSPLPDAVTALLVVGSEDEGGRRVLCVNPTYGVSPEIIAWAKDPRPDPEEGAYLLWHPESARSRLEEAQRAE